MFDLDNELKEIETVVFEFQQRLLNNIKEHLNNVVANNKDIAISFTDNTNQVIVFDVIDGMQVSVFVTFEEDSTLIEVVKEGASMGHLEENSDTYKRYLSFVQPIEDAYRSYFCWDGADFLKDFKQ